MIAEVVVDIKNKAVDRLFDYEIPVDLSTVVKPGVRVLVPFGPRSLSGVVINTKDKSDFDGKLRPITKVMDIIPAINEELLALGIELGKTTGSTLISCFDAMIPAAMKSKYKKMYVLKDENSASNEVLQLFAGTDVIDETVVAKNHLKFLKRGIDDGAVVLEYSASDKLGTKTKRYVALTDGITDKLTPKQAEVVAQLQNSDNPIAKSDILASDAVLKGLIAKGIVAYLDVEVYRDPYAQEKIVTSSEANLNQYQEEAVNKISSVKEESTFLLHGITGSGKTEVYLQAIAKTIEKGKQALVLIPEITLTTQLTARFKARFGSNVAVIHSGLSMGEKYDEWRKINRSEVDIVIGARSAVFSPLKNIGLIIIDEEHEATYKQDEMPRYHTIEVAKWRAKYHNCALVLGSATPSLESYARAKKDVYQLLELPERAVKTASVPTVKLIDLNNQQISNTGNIISSELISAIKKRLSNKEQVILFLNRRGYANFMQCRECHDVVSCPNCDVTLTYHKQFNGLKCHYCNHTTSINQMCPKCESPEVRFFGTGTQKVVEFLEELLPGANIMRMDVDATSKKGDHARIIKSFENQEADILIGTQMVAKGLDFPGVTLVGVLDADTMLHFPDYKATERTFQILTQVAGRSGRHTNDGEVYIETFSPNHCVMQHVKNHNYVGFYEDEMKNRRLFKYSPYFFHAKVLLSSLDPEALLVVSDQVNSLLRQKLGSECLIIGPTMPSVARVNKRFRMHFILKYRQSEKLKPVILDMLEHIENQDVSLAVDYFPTFLA